MATLVVMYTLRRHGQFLLGPINRRIYGSFAAKRHAFEVARREADKRGFTKDSGKLLQIVTDGDDDLACYVRQTFPEAVHTLDVIHAVEYLWMAGECLYRDGSAELAAWVEEQKDRLYRGEAEAIVATLGRRLAAIPATGPGNKGKRDRLETAMEYLAKRLLMMNYDELRAQDLDISSGAVEGAVRYVIGLRFDYGGMRWIKERAEALLQLRCIEINGDWDAFVGWVHDDMHAAALAHGKRLRLQQSTPSPLPQVAEAA